MVQALLRQRVAQGLHHMLLPHHFGEVPGAVFAGEHEVGHRRGILGPTVRTPNPIGQPRWAGNGLPTARPLRKALPLHARGKAGRLGG
ncbi:hypothetical protein GCM10023090_08280 [Acidovorax lacteus]|uniref:Uncharacterized protein n=1 Tax=Acidovorax lacteus TaxID=1924988 RepID=A0ABP8L0U4_9BURK